MPTGTSGPTPRPRRCRASRLARVVQLAVASARSPSRTTAIASGVRAACRSKSCAGIRRAGTPRACRSTRRAVAVARPPLSSGSSETRRSGSATIASSRFTKCASIRSTVGASKRSVLYMTARRIAPRAPPRRSASDRTSPSSNSTSNTLKLRPGVCRRSRGAFCRANITWKSGVRLDVALGLELLDQLLERHVLMRVRAERRLADAAEQLAEASGRRRGLCAARSVLTKKPMRSSTSARLRLAMGVPTTMSSWPRVAVEQRLEGRQQRHEERRALALAELP